MKEFSVSLRDKLKKMDKTVALTAIAMTALSILVLWGGSDVFKGGHQKVIIQCVSASLGIILMIGISLLDYDEVCSKFELVFFAVSVALMLLTIVLNLNSSSSTNKNWITIKGLPFSIQPAEFVKITFIITFSRHVDRLRDEINKIKNVAILMVHAGIILGLIMITGDLGTVLVYMFIVAAILFAAGLSLWYFAAAALIVVLVSPILWGKLKVYQQNRIIVGFNPELDPEDFGYQALMSKKAIISGGFTGAGIKGGTQFGKVPAAHSDFLFCVLAEKLGFFGTLTYIVLMAALIIRLLVLSRRTRKDYASLICVGVAAVLIAQTLENIGMCLAMLPVVGITLPFFSYGGSSMLAMYIALGVIQSICTHNKKYYFERETSRQ
ncbi:MAG: FtsW/RodA/SpoVE family cell cycle protein [Clostridiales bacterium]|nr:FtsW/RodA/SpoVE family cell cycle protein [Clostridiales bacterium]